MIATGLYYPLAIIDSEDVAHLCHNHLSFIQEMNGGQEAITIEYSGMGVLSLTMNDTNELIATLSGPYNQCLEDYANVMLARAKANGTILVDLTVGYPADDANSFQLVDEFWDCECDEGYIQTYRETSCDICGALEEDQPNSRLNEIIAMFKKGGIYVQCQNCQTVWHEGEIADRSIPDLCERVAPGEVMPFCECPDPECGALCHIHNLEGGAK